MKILDPTEIVYETGNIAIQNTDALLAMETSLEKTSYLKTLINEN